MISPVKVWRRQKQIKYLLNQKGKVITWTYIRVASKDHKSQAPYLAVMIELKNKKRIYGQLVDCLRDEVKIGMKVKTVLRKVRPPENGSVIAYGIKVKPI